MIAKYACSTNICIWGVKKKIWVIPVGSSETLKKT